MRSNYKTTLAILTGIVLCCTFLIFAKDVFLDTTVVVEPGKARYFSLKSIKRNGVRVEGHFRARGGSRNDIIVYIFDDIGLENHMNGNRAETYYNSGRVTVGKIDVNLKPGNYHLVFDNSFSTFSNKAVQTFIELDER